MATTPYEIIAGPANVWVGPVGTTMPAVNEADPVDADADWVPLGFTEGGVKVKHSQTVELIRVDQRTGPVKAIRSEELLEVGMNLAELSLENFGIALNDAAVGNANIAATLTTALTGANNDLLFTAVTPGAAGNNIRIRYVVSGNNTALSVSVASNDITVNVATDGGGAATSTAAQVDAAIDASGPASALVTPSNAPTNSGAGVVTAMGYTSLAGGIDASDLVMYQGKDVAQFALLVRGPSPYGDFNLQYQVPIVVQTEEPEVEFVRDDKAVLATKWVALEDPDAATEDDRFGSLVAQSA